MKYAYGFVVLWFVLHSSVIRFSVYVYDPFTCVLQGYLNDRVLAE